MPTGSPKSLVDRVTPPGPKLIAPGVLRYSSTGTDGPDDKIAAPGHIPPENPVPLGGTSITSALRSKLPLPVTTTFGPTGEMVKTKAPDARLGNATLASNRRAKVREQEGLLFITSEVLQKCVNSRQATAVHPRLRRIPRPPNETQDQRPLARAVKPSAGIACFGR